MVGPYPAVVGGSMSWTWANDKVGSDGSITSPAAAGLGGIGPRIIRCPAIPSQA